MHKIYSGKFRIDQQSGSGVFTLTPVPYMVVIPVLLGVSVVVLTGLVLSALHVYLLFAAAGIAILCLSTIFFRMFAPSPVVTISKTAVEFANVTVTLNEIIQLQLSKAELTGLQKIAFRMKSSGTEYYYLVIKCRERQVGMPFVLEKSVAENIAWLVVRTMESKKAQLISILTPDKTEA